VDGLFSKFVLLNFSIMKKYLLQAVIVFLFCLVSSTNLRAQGTATLSVISLPNYPDTAYEGQSYSFDILVVNNTNFTVNIPVFINIEVDSTTAVLDSVMQPLILPGDSLTLTVTNYDFSPNFYKAGNNIVVVWPVVNGAPVIPTDSLFTDVFFVPLNSIANPIPSESSYIAYPVPSNDYLYVSIPPGVMPEHVRIYSAEGRLVKQEFIFRDGYFDIHGLAAGHYFLEIATGFQTQRIRFIRQ
jgi:hypothetical protein